MEQEHKFEVLRFDKEESKRKENLIEEAEKLVERCRSGKCVAFLVFEEGQKEYSFNRVNMSYEKAFLGLERVAYRLNKEWDEIK